MNNDTREDLHAILHTVEGAGFTLSGLGAVVALVVVLHSGTIPARELAPMIAFAFVLACVARFLRTVAFPERDR